MSYHNASGAPPIRKQELATSSLAAWVSAGYDFQDATRYLNVASLAASHPNVALDVRLPSAWQYRWDSLRGAIYPLWKIRDLKNLR